MTARDRRLAIIVALTVVTFAASLLGLVALINGGEARIGSMRLMSVAAGYDREAIPLLAAPAVPSSAKRRRAADLSRNALQQFPYDLGAWLRLAYVDDLDHGGLTAQGVADLRRSYDLIAVDSELGFWRVRFALENSQSLPPDLRAQVRREVSAMSMYPNHRATLQKMLPTIRNPAGRLSLALWLTALGVTVAK